MTETVERGTQEASSPAAQNVLLQPDVHVTLMAAGFVGLQGD